MYIQCVYNCLPLVAGKDSSSSSSDSVVTIGRVVVVTTGLADGLEGTALAFVPPFTPPLVDLVGVLVDEICGLLG